MQPLSSEIHVPSTSPDQRGMGKPTEAPDLELARIIARNDWVGRYVAEQNRLTNGRTDAETDFTEGIALYHVVGHRPPEDVSRQHFNSLTGAADTLTSAVAKFNALALEVGLAAPGAELTREQLAFAHGVAELCAAVGDQVRTVRDGSAGDLIRANYGPVPF